VDSNLRKIHIALKDDPQATLNYRMGNYTQKLMRAQGVLPGAAPAGAEPASDPSVKPPVLILKREPEYSLEARKAKYQGTVMLSVEVDTSGVPGNIRVLRSLGLGLDEKAIEAVSQWRFKPGTKDGKPITLRTEVEVDFRLL
jgi:TonB family protein